MHLHDITGKTIADVKAFAWNDKVTDLVVAGNETGTFFTVALGFTDGTAVTFSTCGCCGLYFDQGGCPP